MKKEFKDSTLDNVWFLVCVFWSARCAHVDVFFHIYYIHSALMYCRYVETDSWGTDNGWSGEEA